MVGKNGNVMGLNFPNRSNQGHLGADFGFNRSAGGDIASAECVGVGFT
jgi:hypothetical protein